MSLFSKLKTYIKEDRGVSLAMVVRGPEAMLGAKALIPNEDPPEGSLLETPLRDDILAEAKALIPGRKSATRYFKLPTDDGEEEVELFFDVYQPAPRLIIVGAVHIAVDLIAYAQPLGLQTYVVDPRTAFATENRFAHADYMIHGWPDEVLPEIGLNSETSVVVVTHDPKLDDPALMVALPSPAIYVGALGSPKTHAKRVKRLQEAGLAPELIERLHAPIGLNIGGRTPAEIALSIIAEIVAVRNHMQIANRQPVAA